MEKKLVYGLRVLPIDLSHIEDLVQKLPFRSGTLYIAVHDHLRIAVMESDFKRDWQTDFAYRAVSTYLDDGYAAVSSYWKLRPDTPLSLDHLLQILNMLVGGLRSSPTKAVEASSNHGGRTVRCVYDGYWPTCGDIAAILCYAALQHEQTIAA